MASGKKGKKTKGKTVDLSTFLQDTPGPAAPTAPIRKNWADEVEDSYDGSYEPRPKANIVLPTAPKASRDYEDISEKVPKEPPYMAYLSNLPYDVDEDEIELFFKNMKISRMNIPKDERQGEFSKLKGFGYIEFADRDSLINALVLPDTTLKNRRIRIEVATNSENDKRRGGRMDMNKDRSENAFDSDWRSAPRAEYKEPERRQYNRDNREFTRESNRDFTRENNRDFTKERETNREFTRDGNREFSRDSNREFTRDGNRDFNRDNNRDFKRENDNSSGAWRDEERVNRDNDRNYSRGGDRDRDRDRDDSDRGNSRFGERRGFNNERRGFGDRDRDRGDRGGSGGGGGGGGGGFGDKDDRSDRCRPRLNLAPRSLPVEKAVVAPAAETVSTASSVPAASIFGSAKPVDTAEKDRQIEERLAKEHTKRDNSRERRGAPHRDDNDRERKDQPITRRDNRDNDSQDDEDQRPSSPIRRQDEDRRSPPKADSNKQEEEKRNIDKSPPKRDDIKDKADKEMPKVKELDAPNFAQNNKFAYLQDENSD